MAKHVIDLPEELEAELRKKAELHGKSECEIIVRAIEDYLASPGVHPAEITDPEEVARVLASTAGMWKDRDDLPDLRELRAEWERRFDRVFPGHE